MADEGGEVPGHPPTALDTRNKGPTLCLAKDRLRVSYKAPSQNKHDVGAIQANAPVPTDRAVYYFEVDIVDAGAKGKIAVGFTPEGFKLGRQPGWEAGSYGYHGDDGQKFHECGQGSAYGPTFTTGDTIGAAIHFGKQEMFFTKNGQKLDTAFENVRGSLYPTIGLHSQGETVEINFGQRPFKFDIEGLVMEEKEALRAEISSAEVPPGVLHRIVRNYLLHYGYAQTLKNFDEAAGMTGPDMPSGSGVDEMRTSCEGNPSSKPTEPTGAALQLRSNIRARLMAGDIDGAMELLQAEYPQLLERDGPYFAVPFHLYCQKFVEMCRGHRVEEAVEFARESLAPYRAHELQAEHLQLLMSALALVCYKDPAASELASLLSTEQREAVADIVNDAVLATASAAEDPTAPAPAGAPAARCVLVSGLQQLAAVQSALHILNGNQGEVFNLADHLLPASAPQGGGGK